MGWIMNLLSCHSVHSHNGKQQQQQQRQCVAVMNLSLYVETIKRQLIVSCALVYVFVIWLRAKIMPHRTLTGIEWNGQTP